MQEPPNQARSLLELVKALGEEPPFKPGELVRIATRSPVGHYRVPRYIRGKQAVIAVRWFGRSYTLWLATSRTVPFGRKLALVTFKTNLAGAQVAQAIAPLREVLSATGGDTVDRDRQRFLLVTEAGFDKAEMIQRDSIP
jgi:hypothetical protein